MGKVCASSMKEYKRSSDLLNNELVESRCYCQELSVLYCSTGFHCYPPSISD